MRNYEDLFSMEEVSFAEKKKLLKLKAIIVSLNSVVVAFSGGVDSSFLLKAAKDLLKDKVLAVTADSETYPAREIEAACSIAKDLKVKHSIIRTEELNDENFVSNSPLRCYHCKKELFSKLIFFAESRGFENVVSGANYDDIKDYRPGMSAARELGIFSPLKEAHITKDEIRKFSGLLALSTWNKPAYPCLSTRFPYGTKITKEKLSQVRLAEELLFDMGFNQVRVRVHDDIARIEVPKDDLGRFLDGRISEIIVTSLKKIGYTYISLDLEGYRSGSMNESLDEVRVDA